VVGGRDALTRDQTIPIPNAGDLDQKAAQAELTKYAASAAGLMGRSRELQARAAGLATDPTLDDPARAARIRSEVVAPLRELLRDAEAYQPPTPRIGSVHLASMAFLRAAAEGYESFATSLESGDTTRRAAVPAQLEEAGRHFDRWYAGLADLMAAAGMLGDQATGTTGPAVGGPSQPAPTTTLVSVPPAELTANAKAEASDTASDSVDDAGNPVSYNAANLLDSDPSTAWRVEGSGQGAGVGIRLPAPARITQVGLIPGYAKTDPASGKDRFRENRRIRAVRWHFSDGTVIGQRFQDRPTMQRTTVKVTASWVLVEIVTTLPGDPDHDYTAISEISLAGTT
jgi:hypothetical protein